MADRRQRDTGRKCWFGDPNCNLPSCQERRAARLWQTRGVQRRTGQVPDVATHVYIYWIRVGGGGRRDNTVPTFLIRGGKRMSDPKERRQRSDRRAIPFSSQGIVRGKLGLLDVTRSEALKAAETALLAAADALLKAAEALK